VSVADNLDGVRHVVEDQERARREVARIRHVIIDGQARGQPLEVPIAVETVGKDGQPVIQVQRPGCVRRVNESL